MNDIKFTDLNIGDGILKAINKLGYEKPTEVQAKVIPLALSGADIIVKSQTGSGKTAAFGIPLCEKAEIESNKPQALILTPTRELCVQIKEDISNIGRLKKVRCAAVFGKQPFDMQAKELKQRVHIVAGTPGRTLDHIKRGTINLENIKYLILDEADEMLNMGFIEQVEEIINNVPEDRITMLFSATMPEKIEKLCVKYMKNPISIDVNNENLVTENIQDIFYEVEENEKFDLLNRLFIIEKPESCIIFCNTRDKVDYVLSKLKSKKYPSAALHGGLEQQERLNTIRGFKRGAFKFLVATDVAARGIDVENVSLVVNFELPFENENYVHRIGRTGRAGKEGKAISFASPKAIRAIEEIQTYLGRKIEKGEIPSLEEVLKNEEAFLQSLCKKPVLKKDKSYKLNEDITKIYINAGKKKKIRAGDIAGAISSIAGINSEDIGIIDIQDNHSYVDILNGKGMLVLEGIKAKTIKGKIVRCEKASK